jgi:hypothetical protein
MQMPLFVQIDVTISSQRSMAINTKKIMVLNEKGLSAIDAMKTTIRKLLLEILKLMFKIALV